MKGEGKGQTFVHTEQDRAVSREVDRGLPSLYLRQAADRLTPPLDMPLPATTHATSAVPNSRQATMPRTLERLGPHPYATRCPRTGLGLVSFCVGL